VITSVRTLPNSARPGGIAKTEASRRHSDSGKAVAQGGFSGLLYRSTKGAGACLVVFTDNLKRSGSWLEVQDGSRTLERLP